MPPRELKKKHHFSDKTYVSINLEWNTAMKHSNEGPNNYIRAAALYKGRM